MALSANTQLTLIRGEQSEFPQDAATVYEGAMLGDNSGYARGLVAGDAFLGHATEYYDNSGGSQGDHNIKRMRGRYRGKVTLTGVAVTDVGAQVYASADDTLTLTPGSNSRVGVVDRYVTTNTAIVEFQTTEVAAIASDLTALLSDLALNSYSDFNTYVSDTAVNKSDIVVIKSDRTVSASDITALRSDVTILQSDRTAIESDITVLESDRTTAESDITVLESDRTTAASDRTTLLSDVKVAISDAQVASGAGDWVNVSDIKVTVTEILTALSDALN